MDVCGKIIKNTLSKEVDIHETYQNFEGSEPGKNSEKRRLRRMPDILPVCLQNFLHRCKSEM